ncbi:alcohol dehydrogenase catalytic domain-containing protein [Brevundimonas sp.]
MREGIMPQFLDADGLPAVLGCDVAGVVEAVGSGVRGWSIGDQCMAMTPDHQGGYADRVTIGSDLLAPIPPTLVFTEAAAMPLAGLTAWQGLVTHGALRRGSRVLIHAAAGGVGHFAVQIARAAGATVFATASGFASWLCCGPRGRSRHRLQDRTVRRHGGRY